MESFTQWDRFITPSAIKVLYWIAMVVVVVAGIALFIMGLIQTTFPMVIMGIAYVVLGPIMVRICAELILLGFRIYEALIEIRDRVSTPSTGAAPSSNSTT